MKDYEELARIIVPKGRPLPGKGYLRSQIAQTIQRAVEDALNDVRKPLLERLARLEDVAIAAKVYVAWCKGLDEVSRQRELWEKFEKAVEALDGS